MFFWKMFFIASFTFGHFRITMLCTIMMALMSPGVGLICLLFHIGIHAPRLRQSQLRIGHDKLFKDYVLCR